MKMLILTREDIKRIVDIKDIIAVVEKSYLEVMNKTAVCPHRLFIDLKRYKGFMFFMPAWLKNMGAMATKIGGQYEENLVKHRLPTILGSIILNDPETSELLALMEGTFITALRTGAVSAVATKYLARHDSRNIGVIGCGAQARTQLWAVVEVLQKVERIMVFDIVKKAMQTYIEEMTPKLEINIESAKNCRECVTKSDVIISATTSKIPVLDGEWVEYGTHINSIGMMGADAREMDNTVLQKSKIIVDTKEGVLAETGDFIIPIREGIISESDIYAELSEIVAGAKQGRNHYKDITFFKTVGTATTDAATAKLIYERAIEEEVGVSIKL